MSIGCRGSECCVEPFFRPRPSLGLPPDDDDDDDAVYLFLQKQQIAYQHIPIGLDHVDQLPRRAWISSSGDSGSTPLKCVDSLP